MAHTGCTYLTLCGVPVILFSYELKPGEHIVDTQQDYRLQFSCRTHILLNDEWVARRTDCTPSGSRVERRIMFVHHPSDFAFALDGCDPKESHDAIGLLLAETFRRWRKPTAIDIDGIVQAHNQIFTQISNNL